MNFCLIKSLSKNGATIGDEVILDGAPRTVTDINRNFVYLTKDIFYPKKQFDRWIRLHYHQVSHKTAIKNRKDSFNTMVKAWQDSFKPGSFVPQNTYRSYIIMHNPNSFPCKYNVYFGTTEQTSVDDLLKSFPKDGHVHTVESSGKYLTLPNVNQNDLPIVVLFPNHTYSNESVNEVIQDINSYTNKYILKLRK